MTSDIGWWQVVLRLVLSMAAGALIGLNREHRGRAAGLRTMVLVALAACGIMLTSNMMLSSSGDVHGFVRLGIMRMPEGVLSGVGFLGAGTIIRRSEHVIGVTTAAGLWIVTVIGLIFGTGLYGLGCAVTVFGSGTMLGFVYVEGRLYQQHEASVCLTCTTSCRHPKVEHILSAYCCGHTLLREEIAGGQLVLTYRLKWTSQDTFSPRGMIDRLSAEEGVKKVVWQVQDVP